MKKLYFAFAILFAFSGIEKAFSQVDVVYARRKRYHFAGDLWR